VQRSFEERLGRQLGEMEAAIRRDIFANARQLEAKLSQLADLVAVSQSPTGQAQPQPKADIELELHPPDDHGGQTGRGLSASRSEVHVMEENQSLSQPRDSAKLQEVGVKLDHVGKVLEHVATAVGVRASLGTGDDEEDRRRLKEKLKEALERDRRDRIRDVVSEREVWLEYVFGICKPDRRTGRRGSRYGEESRLGSVWATCFDTR
jgi:hypothetical protein